jgi:hypothetical protein
VDRHIITKSCGQSLFMTYASTGVRERGTRTPHTRRRTLMGNNARAPRGGGLGDPSGAASRVTESLRRSRSCCAA